MTQSHLSEEEGDTPPEEEGDTPPESSPWALSEMTSWGHFSGGVSPKDPILTSMQILVPTGPPDSETDVKGVSDVTYPGM